MLIDRNKICRLVLVCLLLFITCDVLSQRVERTIVDWQPTHYSVAVALNDSLTEISAVTDIDLQVLNGGLSRLEVQFGDLSVDSIKTGATNLSFERKPGLIVISLPKSAMKGSKMRVSISYHGIPKDGLILTR